MLHSGPFLIELSTLCARLFKKVLLLSRLLVFAAWKNKLFGGQAFSFLSLCFLKSDWHLDDGSLITLLHGSLEQSKQSINVSHSSCSLLWLRFLAREFPAKPTQVWLSC